MINQILNSITIILGITAGELIAIRAFGIVKNNYQRIAELILLVSIFTIVSTEIKPEPIYSFILGLSTIVFIRGASSALKYSATKLEDKIRPPQEKDITLALIIKNLKKYGHSEKEIEDILKDTNFSGDLKNKLKNNVFEQQFRLKKK